MVHNLKLDGGLFRAIRIKEQTVVPIHSKKVGLIEVGDTIEFLSLSDRQQSKPDRCRKMGMCFIRSMAYG